jgi:hypothetical protein
MENSVGGADRFIPTLEPHDGRYGRRPKGPPEGRYQADKLSAIQKDASLIRLYSRL